MDIAAVDASFVPFPSPPLNGGCPGLWAVVVRRTLLMRRVKGVPCFPPLVIVATAHAGPGADAVAIGYTASSRVARRRAGGDFGYVRRLRMGRRGVPRLPVAL